MRIPSGAAHPLPARRGPSSARPAAAVLAVTMAFFVPLLPAPALADPGGEVIGAVAGASGYVLPLPGLAPAAGSTRAELVELGVLVNAFVDPGPRWGAGHRGVDLAAESMAEVVAPRAGVVSFVGVVVDRPLIVITHPDGRRSTLEPVVSDRVVGAQVSAGDRLGWVAPEASTHCAPRQCVHWGVRSGGDYLDPLTLLGAYESIVLLPLG